MLENQEEVVTEHNYSEVFYNDIKERYQEFLKAKLIAD